MAFKNELSERLDELRFPSSRSPPSEPSFPLHNPFSPAYSNFTSAFSRTPADVRSNIQRRFTTDSGKLSSWGHFSQGTLPMPDPLDMMSSTNHFYKSQLFEKKRQHIEYMREQKRRFEEDMKLLDLQHERERQEMDQLARELAKASVSGPVSEPTTPPEHHGGGFTGAFSRPARFSTSSVTSSPGFFSAFAPSSHIASPPSQANTASRFSVHSMPGSRRNSEKEDFSNESSSFHSGPFIHRYSMSSTGPNAQFRSAVATFNHPPGLDSLNTAKYLFPGAEDQSTVGDEDRIPTPDIRTYLRMTDPDDKFPILSRRNDSGLLSANPDTLDLASSRTPGPGTYTHNRNRIAHQSMPQNTLDMLRLGQLASSAGEDHHNIPDSRHQVNRRSIEANLHYKSEGNLGGMTSMTSTTSSRPASLHSSYSATDLSAGKDSMLDSAIPLQRSHRPSLSRASANAENTSPRSCSYESGSANPSSSQEQRTVLQANAAPFGPHMLTASSNAEISNSAAPTALPTFQAPFYGYGVQPYMGNPIQAPSQYPNYNSAGSYGPFTPYSDCRFPEGPAKGPNSRRSVDSEGAQLSRFVNFPLEHYQGDLYNLCKDQHGCRYLQRKLEEHNPEHVQMIFNEIRVHVVELMTDPFGNYLCQKLLEYSNDDQRTALMNHAAPQLVRIALNQHGTRALQKMIEFISTAEQTQTVIRALQNHVVELVQDLNGNHVIQKCLNRLPADDAQFIYDAVGADCVTVGTHRHGCCVLQRCIDHASGEQRARLISQITSNAFSLVQDPFGNYVVQYILDLGEPHFTEPLCEAFKGNIPALSKQKFSSNVIEKCLRTASRPISCMMIDEMLAGNELEKMLRDSFANYVIQTAMDFADPETHVKIVEAIRPILPSIRQTPHGRRIASKIVASEGCGKGNATASSEAASNEMNSNQLPSSLAPLATLGSTQFSIPAARFQSSNMNSHFSSPSFSSPPLINGVRRTGSHVLSAAAQAPSGSFGAQGQLYAYF